MTPEIRCYECDKQLRVDGLDLEEIHMASNGEYVCKEHCDVCAAERRELSVLQPDSPELRSKKCK